MSLDPGDCPHQHQLGGGRLHLHRDGPGRPEGGAGQGYRQKSRSAGSASGRGGSASGRGGRVVEFLADPDSASITGQI